MTYQYKVSDADIERLQKELKGDIRKVAAIVVTVEHGGRMTDEQIADVAGVSRMTLWRWKTYDYVYQYELERQYKKQQDYFRKQFKKKARKYSAAEIMSDFRMVEMIVDGLKL